MSDRLEGTANVEIDPADDPFADYPQDLMNSTTDEIVELDGLLPARLKQARKQLRKIVRRLAESLNQVEAEEHQLFPQVDPDAWIETSESEQARAERWQRLVWRLEQEAGESAAASEDYSMVGVSSSDAGAYYDDDDRYEDGDDNPGDYDPFHDE